jgi:hypothetical protein
MSPMRHIAWLVIAVAPVASGCTRATIRTEVHADGSWTRTEGFRACNETELREVFAPPLGAGWTAIRAEVDGGVTHTARRTFLAGDAYRRDLILSHDAAGGIGQQLESEVTIRRDGARRWQYREVLRWHGPRPKPFLDRERELQRRLLEELPDGLASEKEVRDLARRSLRAGWRILVGPVEGWQTGPGHEEFAERHAQMRLGIALDRLLAQKFGRKLAPENRRTVVRKLVAVIPSTAGEAGQEFENWFDANETGRISLMFTVKLPGRLIATNGEFDPVAGEVLWGLYAAAPALEEVVLVATGEQAAEREVGAAGAGRVPRQ